MGRNSKQRRDARKRKARRAGAGQRPGPGAQGDWLGAGPGADSRAAYDLTEMQVVATVRRMSRRRVDEAELLQWAESLVRRAAPAPRHLVEEVLAGLLASLVDDAVAGGWGPGDLAELTRRDAHARHLPTLAAALHDEARRSRRYGPQWLAAVDAIAPETRLRLDTLETMASGLWLAALLATAPRLDPDALVGGAADPSPTAEHPKLAQVRALLAKAESTQFDEEAEALSAKAQQLISRYALEQLVSRSHDPGGEGPGVRRLWLDAPYVGAKAILVDEVAAANRCRSAVAERFGFCVLVGSGADLDAVELLVTSLLVQADTAMLRQGRRVDTAGRSRTRSFRQSFLVGYAHRIGERLSAATEAAAGEHDASLLPVLRDHETRVTEAFEAMMPDTVARPTEVSHGEGWAAGMAAAELALLDVNGRITEATG